MAAMAPKLLSDLLRQERKRQKLSRGKLSRATVRVGYDGVPESTIESYEVIPGRVPEAETLEALADALGIRPEAFYEYPIALARRDAKTAAAAPAATQAALERLSPTQEQEPRAPGQARNARRARAKGRA